MKKQWLCVLFVMVLVVSSCGGSDASTTAESDAPDSSEAVTQSDDAVEDEAPESTEEPDPTAAPDPTAEPTEAPEPTEEPVVDADADTDTTSPVAAGSGCGAGTAPGTSTISFDFEDRTRTYEQLVPASYDDEMPLPVVLNWHGLGSNGVEQLAFSGYAGLAEQEGFIVIAPTGVPNPGDQRNSWELTPDSDTTRDDLAFANEVLDQVIASLCVDDRRVYTTGMSNGGYFSSVLVCEMSDRIAAAAAIAALTREDDCDPSRAVPLIGFHGTDDLVVPYEGGESSLAPGQAIELFERRILVEFGEFAIGAGCSITPTITEESESVNSYAYSGCPDNVEMTFYEIEGGGHTWPGSLISLAISEASGLGATTTEIDASAKSWAFFQQYALPAP